MTILLGNYLWCYPIIQFNPIDLCIHIIELALLVTVRANKQGKVLCVGVHNN